MNETLKITNVLADPTRYYIYQYILKKHTEVTVHEIAGEFSIHVNVARLHLTKLTDVNLLQAETKKTGKGGRPSRYYHPAPEAVQLTFPFRDYQLLSKIAIQALTNLGTEGMHALHEVGQQFGAETIKQAILSKYVNETKLTFEQRILIFKDACNTAGLSPAISVDENSQMISLQIHNCPFKELASKEPSAICAMHTSLLKGIAESIFDDASLEPNNTMLQEGHLSCGYQIHLQP